MKDKQFARFIATRVAKANSINRQVIKSIYKKLLAFYGAREWWPGDTRFEIAVGAILTQNTSWTNVEKAIGNLKKKRVLTAGSMHRLSANELADVIRPAGYYNVKAKRLRAFTQFLADYYDMDMARMRATETELLRRQLLSVNGVGQETADSILLYALGRPVFVIDAYTKRIMSRHGVADVKASYEEYQSLFYESLELDAGLFNEYHALLVSVGKDFCKPVPKCEYCPLVSSKK
jgi:endonuclease-3 related protein